ncbi:MAG: hypothetical protein ABJA02_07950 [Acidobacteriota bacterium]
MTEKQYCSICNAQVPAMGRYPQYVCGTCYLRATDEDGRSISFSNVSLSGGFAALYRDTHEERHSDICYIDGIKCRAEEARFGGIVVQPYDEES